MKPEDVKLDEFEREIEDGVDYVPVSLKDKRKMESLIREAKKNRTISLRIREYDLEKIKERAAQEGMPYQTLINSVLHKYVTNRLHDDKDVMLAVRAMQAPYEDE